MEGGVCVWYNCPLKSLSNGVKNAQRKHHPEESREDPPHRNNPPEDIAKQGNFRSHSSFKMIQVTLALLIQNTSFQARGNHLRRGQGANEGLGALCQRAKRDKSAKHDGLLLGENLPDAFLRPLKMASFVMSFFLKRESQKLFLLIWHYLRK